MNARRITGYAILATLLIGMAVTLSTLSGVWWMGPLIIVTGITFGALCIIAAFLIA